MHYKETVELGRVITRVNQLKRVNNNKNQKRDALQRNSRARQSDYASESVKACKFVWVFVYRSELARARTQATYGCKRWCECWLSLTGSLQTR